MEYGADHNPTSRKIVFPAPRGRFDAAHDSGETIDLPMKDAQHRPWRGKIIAITHVTSGIVRITAELELQ